MIFVTIGTFEMQFNRLLEQLELCNFNEEVIIQCGYTNFTSNKYKVISFMDGRDFEKYINDASIVICHGGVGSILNALKKGKKVIAVPRLEKYNEHVDDHQIEIVDKFTKDGYILNCKDEKQLANIVKEAKEFTPRKYEFDNSRLVSFIDKCLESL